MTDNTHYTTYGFDPGLTRGAIVLGTFEFSGNKHTCLEFEVIHSWQKDTSPVGAKTPMLEIGRHVHKEILPRFVKPAWAVGVEFSAHSVYWRAQKSQVVALAYLLGYLEHGLHSHGMPVTHITVEQLKKAFRIQPKEKKEEYQSRPIKLIEVPALKFKAPRHHHPSDYQDDVFDAFLLAYLTAYLIHQKGNYEN